MFVFKKARPAGFESKLDRYVSEHSRQPVDLLCQVWDAQRTIITYEELNVALLNGFEAQFREWQGDYARFVNGKLAPMWLDAMKAAADNDGLTLDDTEPRVREWIAGHGAELATRLTEQAKLAVRNVIMHGQASGMASEQIAHMIRPLIGLNAPQAAANQRYYERMVAALTRGHPRTPAARIEEMARQRQLKYAGRQHRYRADTIATTELAFAYNKGQHEGVRQAIQRGLMDNCVKVWSTAASERTCPECSALNGQRAKFDEPFDGGYDVPPAHPRCRCTVKYVDATDAGRSAGMNEVSGLQEYPVDMTYINSDAYAKKFENLTGNKVLDENICQSARAMLQHRQGTAIEDGAVFDMTTGKRLLLHDKGIVPSSCDMDITSCLAKGVPLLSMHSHPGSSPFSGSDYQFLFHHEQVKASVVIGHNGAVYYMKKLKGTVAEVEHAIKPYMDNIKRDAAEAKSQGQQLHSWKTDSWLRLALFKAGIRGYIVYKLRM